MVNSCFHVLILGHPGVAGVLLAALRLLLYRPNNHCLFFTQFPGLIRLLPPIISVHYVDSTLLSEYILEKIVQLLGMSPLAP
jgi:hypothetical protein